MFLFERVGAALPKAIFDTGFSARDQRLVFELLKGHLCLEVSAVVMIDLDQGIRALTDPVRPRWPWGHRSVFISPAQQLFLQAQESA
jgi:hypothetical protein